MDTATSGIQELLDHLWDHPILGFKGLPGRPTQLYATPVTPPLSRKDLRGMMEGMHLLLKVSKKKAQICQEKVKYLSFHLSQGQCQLSPERK